MSLTLKPLRLLPLFLFYFAQGFLSACFSAVPAGGAHGGAPRHPHRLAVTTGGWTLSEYTNVMSTVQLVSGLIVLTLGGLAVDALGAQRSAQILLPACVALFAAMALSSRLLVRLAVSHRRLFPQRPTFVMLLVTVSLISDLHAHVLACCRRNAVHHLYGNGEFRQAAWCHARG